ncbi:MAG: U32 family peptidase [Desulfobacula sp.]|nr:U32 family peptidase [Desulfobacula sp.]
MKNHRFKPELLAPAGNFEKLEIAIHYGADAVYLAGKDFSLRNFSGNFSDQQLADAMVLAKKHHVKVYLACNVYSRNNEHQALKDFLAKVKKIGPDAIIIADPGVIFLAKQIIPEIDIHLSTQANTTNLHAVKFWHESGIKRVNLARELSLNEIRQTCDDSPIETETFIHGAMCISYSGRCLLSSCLSGRDSNRGLCSHPCRWKYSVVEELRPNEYHPLMEDSRGSYIFNSKDLCMIEHIPQLIDAGITSLKIEGRMKGINYLASVVKTYRNAIDAYMDNPLEYQTDPHWHDELYQVFHRAYSTGFYFDGSDQQLPNYKNEHKGKIHSFIGKILTQKKSGGYVVGIRNKLCIGDEVEVISPVGLPKRIKVVELLNLDGELLENAHPNTKVILKIGIECQPNDIVRKI